MQNMSIYNLLENIQANIGVLSVSNVKWKQIVSYPSQRGSSNNVNGKWIPKDDEDLETLNF